MATTHDELRDIALAEFARAGYNATSLQRIAELAGVSKSSVLYHFASKEALLEAAIAPALERFEGIVTGLANGDDRDTFVAGFVDLVIEHTLELHMFINQGASLEDVPAFERANELAVRIAQHFATTTQGALERMRFGIALGGAAYLMASQQQFSLEPAETNDEIRVALITIVTDLLAPVPVRSTTP